LINEVKDLQLYADARNHLRRIILSELRSKALL